MRRGARRASARQLDFKKAQLELKLDYERKIKEARKSHASGSSSSAKTAKLPKLVITQFGGALTHWPRLWNQFNRSDVSSMRKFSYLKELMEPNLRSLIDGLPFSTEGHE